MLRLFICSLAIVMAAVVASVAAPPKQLPEFSLLPVAGDPVTAQQLELPGKWLLIFISGSDASDRQLLHALQVFDRQDSAGTVAVVVSGASRQRLEELSSADPKLSGIRWFSDSDRSAFTALHLSGSTMILGMHGNMVAWTVAGCGMDQVRLRSVLLDWVK